MSSLQKQPLFPSQYNAAQQSTDLHFSANQRTVENSWNTLSLNAVQQLNALVCFLFHSINQSTISDIKQSSVDPHDQRPPRDRRSFRTTFSDTLSFCFRVHEPLPSSFFTAARQIKQKWLSGVHTSGVTTGLGMQTSWIFVRSMCQLFFFFWSPRI